MDSIGLVEHHKTRPAGPTVYPSPRRTSTMPVPGYDPDDLDSELEGKLTDGEIRDRLNDEEYERYENGESLVGLLDDDELDDLLDDA